MNVKRASSFAALATYPLLGVMLFLARRDAQLRPWRALSVDPLCEVTMEVRKIISLLSKRRKFHRQERWTRQQLEAYQRQELHRLREYAYARSPFYQRFHQGLFDAPLENLPVLTKAMLMEHFDDLVTDRAVHLQDVKAYLGNSQGDERFVNRYVVNATSGTSGHPGLFLASSDEWSNMLASVSQRVFEEAGIKLKLSRRLKLAQIASSNSSHMSKQGQKSMTSWWMPILQLSVSEPITRIVERLNAWQPEGLLTYASVIRILADEQLAGRLQIAPSSVVSSAEVLTPETRHRAVRAWGNVLFNAYGSTDCGQVASECQQHCGMHLQEDLLIVENVDRDNRPVPTGSYGEKLLITALWRHTQPLIRYVLEDSLRLSANQCPCGRAFRLIDDIQGRIHDILSFPGVEGGSVTVHPLVFYNLMDVLGVGGWQVVQDAYGLRVLLCGVHEELDEKNLVVSIEQALVKQGAIVPEVKVQQVPFIPKNTSGKTPLIRSTLGHS